MLSNLTGWHVLIILAVVLLIFGATRLPALAKAVGQSAKIFKNEMKPDDDRKAELTPAGDAVVSSVATEPPVEPPLGS